jgi:hypothetical protein
VSCGREKREILIIVSNNFNVSIEIKAQKEQSGWNAAQGKLVFALFDAILIGF